MRRGETRRVRRIKNCWLTWRMSTFFHFVFFPFPFRGTKVLFLVLVNFLCFFGFFFAFLASTTADVIYRIQLTVCVTVCVCMYLSYVRVCVSVVLAASAAINYNRASWIRRCCCCCCLSCCWCCCSCCCLSCCCCCFSCCRVVGQLNLNLTLCMSNSAEVSLCCTPCNKQQIAACSLQRHLYFQPSLAHSHPMRCLAHLKILIAARALPFERQKAEI